MEYFAAISAILFIDLLALIRRVPKVVGQLSRNFLFWQVIIIRFHSRIPTFKFVSKGFIKGSSPDLQHLMCTRLSLEFLIYSVCQLEC